MDFNLNDLLSGNIPNKHLKNRESQDKIFEPIFKQIENGSIGYEDFKIPRIDNCLELFEIENVLYIDSELKNNQKYKNLITSYREIIELNSLFNFSNIPVDFKKNYIEMNDKVLEKFGCTQCNDYLFSKELILINIIKGNIEDDLDKLDDKIKIYYEEFYDLYRIYYLDQNKTNLKNLFLSYFSLLVPTINEYYEGQKKMKPIMIELKNKLESLALKLDIPNLNTNQKNISKNKELKYNKLLENKKKIEEIDLKLKNLLEKMCNSNLDSE